MIKHVRSKSQNWGFEEGNRQYIATYTIIFIGVICKKQEVANKFSWLMKIKYLNFKVLLCIYLL